MTQSPRAALEAQIADAAYTWMALGDKFRTPATLIALLQNALDAALAPSPVAVMGEGEISDLATDCIGKSQTLRGAVEMAIRATLSRVPVAAWPGEVWELRQALVNHNDMLRSAHAVAARKGADTNWDTLSPRIGSVLAFHHDTVNAARNALLENASDRILPTEEQGPNPHPTRTAR